MEKQCCNFSVTELEDGYRLEVTGQDVKGRCKTIFEKCCTGENMKNCFQMFGEFKKDKGCC
jgi:hypothetical protein